MRKLESWPLEKIKPDANQPRKHFDEASLLLLGQSLLQGQNDPVQVMSDGTLIDGERRWRAAKLVDLKKLDVIVTERPLTPEELAVARLSTFLHRVGLTAYEEWQALEAALKQNPDWNQKTLAEKLGFDPASITRKLSPGKTIPEFQDALRDGKVTISDCYAASRLKPEDQHGLLAMKLSGASRDDLEREGKKRRNGAATAVRASKIKCPLVSGTTVTVAGDDISLEDAIESLKDAMKAMQKARDTGLDAKTAQAVWRDVAKAG